jgi:hypothetical protein
LGINPRIWSAGNYGTNALDALIVSDAEGYFDAEYDENYAWLVSRNVRASDLLMTRVSELQFDAIGSGEAAPIRIGIKEVLDERLNKDENKNKQKKDEQADHVLSVEKQRALSKLRTDLDAFSSYEVTALIAHGYSVARSSLIGDGLLNKETPKCKWDPLGKLDELAGDTPELTEHLRKGSKRNWRIVTASDPFALLAAVVTVALLGVGIFNGVRTYQAHVQAVEAEAARLVAKQVDAKVGELNTTIDDLRRQLANKQSAAKSPQFTTTSFQVCNGEYQGSCPPSTVWLPCGASVKNWVDGQCTSASITRISSRDGNRCGYSIDQVLCPRRKGGTQSRSSSGEAGGDTTKSGGWGRCCPTT